MARPAPRPRKYEMMIVVAPTVTEDGLPAVVERVSNLIEAQDGEVESFTHDSPWGHRRLAYPIQNFRDAFYVLYYFNAPPRAVNELDRELRLDSVIIRHLIVKFDPLAHREYDADTDTDTDDEDEVAQPPVAAAEESEPDEEETVEAADDSGDSDEADEEGTDAEDDDVGDEEDDSDEDESDDEPEEADDDDSDADETEEADDGEEDEKE